MDYDALEKWISERLEEGEDATVYEFIREVLDKSRGYDELNESAKARGEEYENTIKERDATISDLKARNYDLLMKLQGDSNSGDGEVSETVEDDGELYHIDNLFIDDEEGE